MTWYCTMRVGQAQNSRCRRPYSPGNYRSSMFPFASLFFLACALRSKFRLSFLSSNYDNDLVKGLVGILSPGGWTWRMLWKRNIKCWKKRNIKCCKNQHWKNQREKSVPEGSWSSGSVSITFYQVLWSTLIVWNPCYTRNSPLYTSIIHG